ncbi:hypothetical protein N624_0299 [Levilactobacillus brevis]|nr:hypothetical protein N624_0299 [Levilactobacillus brevis]
MTGTVVESEPITVAVGLDVTLFAAALVGATAAPVVET